jgi:hypothetical protein
VVAATTILVFPLSADPVDQLRVPFVHPRTVIVTRVELAAEVRLIERLVGAITVAVPTAVVVEPVEVVHVAV